MRKHGWVPVLALALGAGLMACGGGETGKSCDSDKACGRGKICDASACKVLECTALAQCGPGVGGDRTCAPIDGMDVDKMYCTALECSNAMPCADATQECVLGLCIAGSTPPDGTPDAVEDTPPAEGTTDLPVETGEEAVQCLPCSTSAECTAPLTCSAAGAGKFCLKPCTGNAECKPGYICYPTSSAGKQCLPMSNDCKKCAYEGCEAGQCCNLVTGECEACKPECSQCTYDFQCAAGHRCYKQQSSSVGVCVKECPDGNCGDGFTCGDNNATDKIKVCVPGAETCKVCPDPNKPHQKSDGSCVECLNSMHCKGKPDGKEFCDNNVCVKAPCTGGQKTCDDGLCHQCCVDADCGADGPCTNYKCANDIGDKPCLDAGIDCSNDPYYPACCVINGSPQCCQCAEASDCDLIGIGCVCNNNSCFDGATGGPCGGGGGSCPAVCTESAECPASMSGTPLECAPQGFCYDPNGSCDPAGTACCAPGQTCFDLINLLFGGMGGGFPGGGGLPGGGGTMPGSGMAYCSCNQASDCLGGKPCTDMAMICAIPFISDFVCAGGSLPSTVPPKMCFDIADLLGGLSI